MKKTEKSRTIKELSARITALMKERKEDWRPTVTISAGTCGRARGSLKVVEAFKKAVREAGLEDKVVVRVTGCHGFCQTEPNMLIEPKGFFYQKVEPRHARAIVEQTIIGGKPIPELLYKDPITGVKATTERAMRFYRKQKRLISGDNRLVDPASLADYFSIGGYRPLLKVLRAKSPGKVIEDIKRSGLRGRGGAGFPTGRKWEATRSSPGAVKYIICNADEGDPGAYMDRSLLEGNPHRIIEGMMIGAYAMGAADGYIYVRDEYPLAVHNVTAAINDLYKAGLLGKDILGTGFDFDLHVAKGAGAFVCGEETALIASIEGRVGEPRQRPPFPSQKGLWGKPTCINNVETWATVPVVIRIGADRFGAIGTRGSKGTKIFSLVGKIMNTGLVEVPMGITLREIIYDIGGGIPGGKEFKAVQTGGPSGGCLPKKQLDLPVDYESLAAAGSIMGSGGMIVMDERTCMVDVAKYFLNFLRDESCGKCVSCREGTQRMYEIMERISEGKGRESDLDLLEELAMACKDSSLCALGQTAANPVLSTLKYFRHEYEAHILDKRCPAGVCKDLIRYVVVAEKCVGCLSCKNACPSGAIKGTLHDIHLIDQEKCLKCGSCLEACRFEAIEARRDEAILII